MGRELQGAAHGLVCTEPVTKPSRQALGGISLRSAALESQVGALAVAALYSACDAEQIGA